MPISENRKRDKNTHWMNSAPVTDLHEALFLLWPTPKGRRGPRYICTDRYIVDQYKPEIHQEWHHEGGSGQMPSSGSHYLQIDPELAKYIIDTNLVVPMQIPHMGYTEIVDYKLVLSDMGIRKHQLLCEAKLEVAKIFLLPRLHVADVPWSRKSADGWGGKLYFDFHIFAYDEHVIVCPDDGTVEVIYPQKEATGT
jgi:hypothetical protein